MGDFSTERLGGLSRTSDALGQRPRPEQDRKEKKRPALPPAPPAHPNIVPDTDEPDHELDELA
ncbi:MAG TPA: hypothetical protein VGF44_02235 [Terriglobales bacterium]|jgi:hypothetical protein